MAETLDLHVSADRLISFLRHAYPRPSKFGGDTGGDPERLMGALADPELVKRIDKELFDADIEYTVSTRSHFDAILSASGVRAAREKALMETLPEFPRIPHTTNRRDGNDLA